MHSHHTDEGAPSASAPTANPEAVDEATARAVIAQAEQRRVQACAEELHAVLAKHGMSLEVTPAEIVLVPRG
ncbi:hypothetical protein ACIP2X_37775 [Streptomyces sp. NPDC089424]|uniref:hypothetical protein n=1 Tax=Streptomyces sp. NPDC089424 TaxID=3365917 RepID=UPI003810ECDC